VPKAVSIVAIILIVGFVQYGCRRTLELGLADIDAQVGMDAGESDGGVDDTEESDSALDASQQDGSVRIPDGVSID
jgi:hypothetical protein